MHPPVDMDRRADVTIPPSSPTRPKPSRPTNDRDPRLIRAHADTVTPTSFGATMAVHVDGPSTRQPSMKRG